MLTCRLSFVDIWKYFYKFFSSRSGFLEGKIFTSKVKLYDSHL